MISVAGVSAIGTKTASNEACKTPMAPAAVGDPPLHELRPGLLSIQRMWCVFLSKGIANRTCQQP